MCTGRRSRASCATRASRHTSTQVGLGLVLCRILLCCSVCSRYVCVFVCVSVPVVHCTIQYCTVSLTLPVALHLLLHLSLSLYLSTLAGSLDGRIGMVEEVMGRLQLHNMVRAPPTAQRLLLRSSTSTSILSLCPFFPFPTICTVDLGPWIFPPLSYLSHPHCYLFPLIFPLLRPISPAPVTASASAPDFLYKVENAFGHDMAVSSIKHAPHAHTLLAVSGIVRYRIGSMSRETIGQDMTTRMI
jgi:hypothetical protein